MSWWVSLANAGPVESFEDGGTYMLGGSEEPSLNITYNYGALYRVVFDGMGLKEALHGRRAGDTLPLLDAGIARLGVKRSANYWDATPGNAGRALSWLRLWARQYPDGTWRVT